MRDLLVTGREPETVAQVAVFVPGFFALACGIKLAPDVAASPEADVISLPDQATVFRVGN